LICPKFVFFGVEITKIVKKSVSQMWSYPKYGRLYAHWGNVFSRHFRSFPVEWYIFDVNNFWLPYSTPWLEFFLSPFALTMDSKNLSPSPPHSPHLSFVTRPSLPPPHDSDHAECLKQAIGFAVVMSTGGPRRWLYKLMYFNSIGTAKVNSSHK